MPLLPASASVRANTTTKSQTLPWLIQSFVPSRIQSSPSGVARQTSEPASEPLPASDSA